MFLVGKKNSMFTALGVAYGYIFIEGRKPVIVFTIEEAARILNDQAGRNTVDQAEADEIMAEVVKAGLAKTISEVYEKFVASQLESGFRPLYQFVVCDQCTNPLPHGHLRRDGSERNLCTPIFTIKDGFRLVVEMFHSGDYATIDCVAVFKQLHAVLPVDDDAAEKLREALPQDKRDELEMTKNLSEAFNIPGLDGVLVIGPAMSVSSNEPSESGDSPDSSDPFTRLSGVFRRLFGRDIRSDR